MTRQLEIKKEARETARRLELVKALEFGIVGALESQGITMVGFAIKYDDFNCLLILKADIDDIRSIAFIGSDSIVNCILKTYQVARNGGLRWRPDQYHTSGS